MIARLVSQVHFYIPYEQTFPTFPMCPEQGHTIYDQLPLVTIPTLKYTFYRNGVPIPLAEDFNSQHPSQMLHNHRYLQLQGTGYLWHSQTCRHMQNTLRQTHTRLKIKELRWQFTISFEETTSRMTYVFFTLVKFNLC